MIRLKCVRVTDATWQEMGCKKTELKLQQLKEMLKEGQVVCTQWLPDANALLLAFADCSLVTMFLSYASFQIQFMCIDKHLCHRFAGCHVTDIVYRENEAIFLSFAEPRVAAVFLRKQNTRRSPLKAGCNDFKLKHKDLKFVDLELDARPVGSSFYQTTRHLLVSDGSAASLPLVCVWWQATCGLNAWTAPCRLDANILMYCSSEFRFEMLSFARIPAQIRRIAYSTAHPSRLLILTSGTTHTQSLDFAVYESGSQNDAQEMRRIFSVHVPLDAAAVQADFSAAQDKLVVLCEDRSCLLYDLNENSAARLQTSISATHILCSPLDSLFLVSDLCGQLLLYDYALSVIPANYDDVCYKANLDFMESMTSIRFLNDHLICLQYSVTEDASSELTLIVLPVGLDVPALIREYLRHDYLAEAIANLSSLSWSFDPHLCYTCLNIISNFLLKLPLNPLRESQMESTLGAFFRPQRGLDLRTLNEYRQGVNRLAKRFFYHLMRFNSLEKAFLLALELKSKHLFLLLLRVSQETGNSKLTQVCSSQIQHLMSRQKQRTKEDLSGSKKGSLSQHQVSSAILVTQPEEGIEALSRRPPIPAPRSTFVHPAQFSPPPIPPKTFLRQTLDINRSPDEANLKIDVSVTEAPVIRSVIRSAVNRQTFPVTSVHVNEENTVKSKPRIECIHFGLV